MREAGRVRGGRMVASLLFAGVQLSEHESTKFHYGGQAVLEGVMMRGPKDFAVAVRRGDGEIVTTCEEVTGILKKLQWLNKPFLRGALMLVDAMALGIRALMYSANIAMEDISAAEAAAKAQSGEDTSAKDSKKAKIVNDIAVPVMMVLGVVMALAIFKLIPIVVTKPLKSVVQQAWQLTVIEGCVKIVIFVGYVYAISFMKDIRRVFQYHGAEHKTINAYESGVELSVENVLNHTKAHVRCGTSFILVVLVTSIIVYAFVVDHLPYGSLADKSIISYFTRWAYNVALLPFVAALSYEVIRFAGNRKDSLFSRMLVLPGLLMQKITTREPDPEMIEVAIRSLRAVLDREAATQPASEP